MPTADKQTRRDQFDVSRAKVRALIARKRAELAALPAPASRTTAQRRTAQDLNDFIHLARFVLLLAGKDEVDDTAPVAD